MRVQRTATRGRSRQSPVPAGLHKTRAIHHVDGPGLIPFVQSTISTLTFCPVRWATDLMIVRISLAMRP